MRVAAHVDQLFFTVPGGVGTYIRNLVPALAGRDPSLAVTLFHARFASPRPSEPWMDGFDEVELQGSIRSLYPRWNLSARPALPVAIRSADLVHAMSASAVPPPPGASAWSSPCTTWRSTASRTCSRGRGGPCTGSVCARPSGARTRS